MAHTTGRYTGAFESRFEQDAGRLAELAPGDADGYVRVRSRVVDVFLTSLTPNYCPLAPSLSPRAARSTRSPPCSPTARSPTMMRSTTPPPRPRGTPATVMPTAGRLGRGHTRRQVHPRRTPRPLSATAQHLKPSLEPRSIPLSLCGTLRLEQRAAGGLSVHPILVTLTEPNDLGERWLAQRSAVDL
jgi:hypothetical protein